MAAATVLPPTSLQYSPQPNALSSSNYQDRHLGRHSPPNSMISSSEPRRAADDGETPARQSLPSISEVISGAPRPGQFPPSSHPSGQPGSSGLPSPFVSHNRGYPDSDKQHSSPQPLHPASFTPRQDAVSSFSESPRPGFSGRPGFPHPDRRSTPPGKLEHPSQLTPTHPEQPRSVSGTYPPQGPHPSSAPSSHPYQNSHLPPGQMPLPGYPISPRHPPSEYESRRPPPHGEHHDYARSRYEQHGPPRHYEAWNYQEAFGRIASHSRTIFNFAELYGSPHAQHGPERLPTEREIGDMLANVDYLKRAFEQVRDVVHASSMQSDRARDGPKPKPYGEGHDVPMYGEPMKAQYPVGGEVKKRRGRAAPPGRCHSCNRVDTPEWRRGPDGARTLCNACGLHYAKLERKRQLEARSIRPKTEERN